MKFHSYFFVFIALTSVDTVAQQQDLQNIVNSLKSVCAKVDGASKSYEQEIKLIAYSAYCNRS